jgi:hypothetical protein
MGSSFRSIIMRVLLFVAVSLCPQSVSAQSSQPTADSAAPGVTAVSTLLELELYESALQLLDQLQASGSRWTDAHTRLLVDAVEGTADDHLLCGNAGVASRQYDWLSGRSGSIDPQRVARWRSREAAARTAVDRPGHLEDNLLPRRRAGRWRIAVGNDWRVRESRRFHVYHRNDYAARIVENAAEFHFDEICAFLGLAPEEVAWPAPARIYLHPSRQELRRIVDAESAALGRSVIRTANGNVDEQAVHLSQDAPLLLSSVLPHELAHLLIAHASGYRPLPPYLDEGLALQFEPPPVQLRYDRIEGRIGQIPALTTLITDHAPPTPQQEAHYAIARLCADFLIERLGLPLLLQASRHPGDLSGALVELGPWEDLDRLDADWSRFAR